MWLQRNINEHESDTNPHQRSKQKIINNIHGSLSKKSPTPFKHDELTQEKLTKIIKRNIMSTTLLYAAQVIIPKQQDNSMTAAVAMITINQNTNKD
jgi:hypothetical protein